MKVFRSGLGDDLDIRAGHASVLGLVVGHQDAYFGHRVLAHGQLELRPVAHVGSGDAVKGDVVSGRAIALNVESRGAGKLVLRGSQDHAGKQLRQVADVATAHQQVFHLARSDHFSALGGAGLHDRSLRDNGNRFRDGAKLQREVGKRDTLACSEDDAFAFHLLETGAGDADDI